MSGCSQIPALPLWTEPENRPKLVVFDPLTNQFRPLNWGEAIPGMDCSGLFIESQIPSSKQMQDAYFQIYQRLISLEKKYCECVCSGPEPTLPPDPTLPPITEPDSWQSDIVVTAV